MKMFGSQLISSCTIYCTTSTNLTSGGHAALDCFHTPFLLWFWNHVSDLRIQVSYLWLHHFISWFKGCALSLSWRCQVWIVWAWTPQQRFSRRAFADGCGAEAKHDCISACTHPVTARLVVRFKCGAETCFLSNVSWWIALIRAGRADCASCNTRSSNSVVSVNHT